MDEDVAGVIVVFFASLLGFLAGAYLIVYLVDAKESNAIESCQKQRNVYQCVLVAVPLEKGDKQ